MNPIKHYSDTLKKEYKFVCGVCGYKWVEVPEVCHCGNDVEFDENDGSVIQSLAND